ncbi:hypothetical protein GCM10023196_007270 [Actinoallomurus vinaceus]|uniref:Uncharacterized protein n=1 Tax=Actinoallomurus vinaceus TaxID=1080074 RepID=A0ABP8U3R2_9ACTN
MTQNQHRGGGNSAPLFLILGGVAGVVVEFAINLVLSYTVKTSSLSVIYVLGGFEAVITGLVTGGVTLLGRPRHYGLAVAAGFVALIAGVIGDLLARPVIWILHDLPVNASTFTGYFTHQTVVSLLTNLLPIVAAAVLTAVGVSRNARTPAAVAPPPGYWNQSSSYGPPQPGPGMGAPPYAPPGPAAGGPPPQGWEPPMGPGGPPPPVQP